MFLFKRHLPMVDIFCSTGKYKELTDLGAACHNFSKLMKNICWYAIIGMAISNYYSKNTSQEDFIEQNFQEEYELALDEEALKLSKIKSSLYAEVEAGVGSHFFESVCVNIEKIQNINNLGESELQTRIVKKRLKDEYKDKRFNAGLFWPVYVVKQGINKVVNMEIPSISFKS